MIIWEHWAIGGQYAPFTVLELIFVLSNIAKYRVIVSLWRLYNARPSDNLLGEKMPRRKEFTGSKESFEVMVITKCLANKEVGPVIAARIVVQDGFHDTNVVV